MIRRRGVNQLLQLGDDRDRERDWFVPAVRLRECEPPVARCWRPNDTTRARRWPVNSRSPSVRRAFDPLG